MQQTQQNRVLVLDRNRQPLMPCHPARARELLREGKAAVFRRFPFTIILQHRESGSVQDARLKLDPGSKTTGIALVASFSRRGPTVVWAGALTHRGVAIRKALEQRRGHRRFRRNRLRYRPARFDNRTRKAGWLAPSLQHRVDTTMAWVKRLMRWAPVSVLSQELVRFDMQQIQNPEISGTEYQQGTLAGYEVREYLLEKWGRKCAYCGVENTPLEIDHIHPRSKGGSNRVSNLTLACHHCNQRKGNKPLEQFLAKAPEKVKRILAQAKAPLRDAAAVNSTRWALFQRLKATNLPVEVSSGGRTKWNRFQQSYPKDHWIDAACVGESGATVRLSPDHKPMAITAMGHGERQRARLNRHGFPVGHKAGAKSFLGFQTGDLVRAVVPKGKYAGTHAGRIAIRFRPSFALRTEKETFDIHPKYLTIVQKGDGYAYA
ncbi:RNA-guided endonuclease IscB [Acidithiobacillus sulfurivorans]|uniref:HNH endonuclease n=1 Tax=Acidithiobacillus sulfurivorans TaxID=1958756 RepID=A0ABS5ZUE3_9PROT|nr:RNA-guided endonuclease IscB [Acidithiobacillus sulfurivorans]MBU2758646.1 HNH endonuclease [Acidithiobacillus sulfurivorans]